jgi:hypothetical protein
MLSFPVRNIGEGDRGLFAVEGEFARGDAEARSN